jgi:hypothetical protein
VPVLDQAEQAQPDEHADHPGTDRRRECGQRRLRPQRPGQHSHRRAGGQQRAERPAAVSAVRTVSGSLPVVDTATLTWLGTIPVGSAAGSMIAFTLTSGSAVRSWRDSAASGTPGWS